MSVKRKILVIENSIHVTGALKSIVQAASDLKHIYSFVFVLPKGSKARFGVEKFGFSAIHEIGLKELSKRLISILVYPAALIVNTVKIKRIVELERVDLIHNNDLYNLVPVVYKLIGGTRPYISHIRFLPNRFPSFIFNFWLRLHLRFADHIIVVSKYLQGQLPASPKLVYIPNELPSKEKYTEADDMKRKTNYTFLYLSNYIPGKGQDYALNAFAMICGDLPEWKLRYVGGDMGLKKNQRFKKRLQARAKELEISNRIDWMDFTEDVEVEYKNADVVLNYSESESFSITCIEALFFGRPLIASDCGGPAEIIDHKESGWLVANRNVASMANAMKLLATDKELRIQLAAEGRRRSRDRFSPEKTSYRLHEIYRKVLE